MNISTNIQPLGAGILYSLTRECFHPAKAPRGEGILPHESARKPCFGGVFHDDGGKKKGRACTLPPKTPSQIPLYHILLWIARHFRQFVFFLFYEQKLFVNFVYFGDCNSQENVLYCNHNRGGTRQWQSKLATLIGYDQQNTTGSEHRTKTHTTYIESDPSMKANVLSDRSRSYDHRLLQTPSRPTKQLPLG